MNVTGDAVRGVSTTNTSIVGIVDFVGLWRHQNMLGAQCGDDKFS
jgi:hypothetical protein